MKEDFIGNKNNFYFLIPNIFRIFALDLGAEP